MQLLRGLIGPERRISVTKREAAIVTAFTKMMIGEFNEFHKYIEEKLDRPVWTHELANEDIWNELHEICKEDFIDISVV